MHLPEGAHDGAYLSGAEGVADQRPVEVGVVVGGRRRTAGAGLKEEGGAVVVVVFAAAAER